jgi:hypothetical protein
MATVGAAPKAPVTFTALLLPVDELPDVDEVPDEDDADAEDEDDEDDEQPAIATTASNGTTRSACARRI